MRSRLARVRGLLRRYRLDRRLPPSVVQLYTDVAWRRVQNLADSAVARIRPVVGRGGAIVTMGRYRVSAAAPLELSLDELAHRYARGVLDALAAEAVDMFLVGRRGDALVFGVALNDRERGLRAITGRLGNGAGWCLDWEDGLRSGTVAVDRAARSRHVRNARRWSIYQPRAWGDLAVGQDQAVSLTFWHPGTSGQLELVGTRGQERFDPTSAPTVESISGHQYPGRAAFPVGAALEHMREPIDIVYTWVDGSDPEWQAQFRATSAEFGRGAHESALDTGRFHSRDELRYSLRSVWAFCGWVRRIYVVTAGQVPAWLAGDPRVRLVDHNEILPADALPTFNSHAIESALHRIDGLAEHFIYFNDDVLIGRSVRPETFFTANGLPLVFQSDARVRTVESDDTLAVDTAARREREILTEHFGRVVTHKPQHSPHPLLRSVMAEIEREFPAMASATAHSRFRSASDVSIAASFARHYAVATGRAVLGTIESDYVHVESGRLGWHLERLLGGRAFDAFCINETEQTAEAADLAEARIRDFFQQYFPVAAPWERDGEPDT